MTNDVDKQYKNTKMVPINWLLFIRNILIIATNSKTYPSQYTDVIVKVYAWSTFSSKLIITYTTSTIPTNSLDFLRIPHLLGWEFCGGLFLM